MLRGEARDAFFEHWDFGRGHANLVKAQGNEQGQVADVPGHLAAHANPFSMLADLINYMFQKAQETGISNA